MIHSYVQSIGNGESQKLKILLTAYANTKDAFSAPLAFVDIEAFYDSHNDERPPPKLQGLKSLAGLGHTSPLLSSHLNVPILLLLSVAARKTNACHSSSVLTSPISPVSFFHFLSKPSEDWGEKRRWEINKHPLLTAKIMTSNSTNTP